MNSVGNHWEEVDYFKTKDGQKAIYKEFNFKNFIDALAFANKVGVLAEQTNHHPDLSVGWGFCSVWLTTHSQGRVTEKDHDLAAKIDRLTD